MSVAAAGLVLAGCSSGDDSSHSGMAMSSAAATPAPAQAGTHNAADVTFAQDMIPHHQQAVEMAGLAASRTTNTQVKDLATRIRNAQDPEIQQMTGWLGQWGATSSSAMPSMPDANHGSMPGMMADADMQRLQEAGGAEFDKMFLQMMVEHHQGAVEMARTELAQGASADAKALAQRIIDSQTAEITEMQQLLTKL
ncbi:DUF305 domain-containing protein [Amycolatopsis alkalitolerans]|uniref:DUF305 domain-containing protein n=2 Tax=Amycolatopsis alkalitolerans TaxID=2547244 RepID=A0A5C4LSA4_9PSEU|nr:DUF305 domain-containing protein [Amycolatopsis alkalitolerans]